MRDPEAPVHLWKDRIAVDGQAIAGADKIYLMLNKPRGVVTTAADDRNRETVYAFVDKKLPWIAPVGRLDKASEGLLLLTNDSEWGTRVLAPATHLDKTYHVQAGVIPSEALLRTLVDGVRTADHELLRAKRACLLRAGEKNSWIEVVLDEGKNRQIRRMFDELKIEVLRLVRVSIGPLSLGKLAKGEVRLLTEGEKEELDSAM